MTTARRSWILARPITSCRAPIWAPGSTIKTVEEVNRAGVRVAGVEGTATFRAAQRTAPNASPVNVKGPDQGVDLMRAGKVDAIALSREAVGGVVDALPGAPGLDGGFPNSPAARGGAK